MSEFNDPSQSIPVQNPGGYSAFNSQGPAVKFTTTRSMIKVILLSIVTLGIYSLFFFSKLRNELNTVCGNHNGKSTMSYWLLVLLLGPITLGIGLLVWYHQFCKRVSNELKYRNIDYKFGAGTFWGWNVFGTFILVGPFIFLHKLCHAFNLMNAHYNTNG